MQSCIESYDKNKGRFTLKVTIINYITRQFLHFCRHDLASMASSAVDRRELADEEAASGRASHRSAGQLLVGQKADVMSR